MRQCRGVPVVALAEIEKVSAELVNREAERRLEVALSRGHAVIGRIADSSADEDAALDDDYNTASAAELHSAINHANGLKTVAPRVKSCWPLPDRWCVCAQHAKIRLANGWSNS